MRPHLRSFGEAWRNVGAGDVGCRDQVHFVGLAYDARPPYYWRVSPFARPLQSPFRSRSLRGFDLDRRLQRGLMLAPAGANVVMQLSRLGVGRGVAESRVHRGSFVRHPLKRTRTTLTFIWISLYGSEDERRALRRSVDAQHRHVRSHPSDEVAYDAFDATLQLWVAACMYVGSLQGYETLHGPASDEIVNALLARCSRFATTLQVPERQWPSDREAFEHYWREALDEVRVDDVTRQYLLDFIDLRFLPYLWRKVLRPLNRLLTLGYLPQEFRAALGVTWGSEQQRRFERAITLMRRLNRVLPGPVATFPWNIVRYDAHRRLARQRPLA